MMSMEARLRTLDPAIRPFIFGHFGDGNLHYNLSRPAAREGLGSDGAIPRASPACRGGTARICGELHFNSATDKFVVSNQSGRYSRYEDRTEAGLNEVARMFAQAGLDVETERVSKYMTARKRATLILPSLDPSRC